MFHVLFHMFVCTTAVSLAHVRVCLTYMAGTVWDYSSLHLKIAGGMAVAASGKDIRTLLDETLAEVGLSVCVCQPQAVLNHSDNEDRLFMCTAHHHDSTHRTPKQLGMSSSYYDMDQNPELAGSLWTTGEDYMKFLESLYYHRILPAEVCGLVDVDCLIDTCGEA